MCSVSTRSATRGLLSHGKMPHVNDVMVTRNRTVAAVARSVLHEHEANDKERAGKCRKMHASTSWGTSVINILSFGTHLTHMALAWL